MWVIATDTNCIGIKAELSKIFIDSFEESK